MNRRKWLNSVLVLLLLLGYLPGVTRAAPATPNRTQGNWQEVLTASYGFLNDLQVYDTKIYALASSGWLESSGAALYVLENGVDWSVVSGFPSGISLAHTLYVFGNRLYIGATMSQQAVIYYYDGVSFVADFTDTYTGGYPGINSFVEHQGALYAMYGHEGRVFKRIADGNWQLVGDVPNCGGRDLESYGDALYMGTGYSPEGCPAQLWRNDSSGWQLLADYRDLTGDAVNALAVYAGKLYVATAYTDRPHYVFEYTQTPTGVIKTNSWLMNTSGDFALVRSELWIGSTGGLYKKVGNTDWAFTSDPVASHVFEYFNGYVYNGVSASDYGQARVYRQPYAYAGPTFVNVASQLGVANGFHVLSAQWVDIDGDKDLDLFAAGGNSTRHYLYENRFNQGQGFVDVTAVWGLSTVDLSAWAVGIFGDYDRDGRPDLWLGQSEKLSTLYHNEGNSFRDVTDEVNLGSVRQINELAGGAAWIDYDNDGDLDLFTSAGTEDYRPYIFRNDYPNGFTQVDLGIEFYSCSAAWGDYDNDGDLDLATGNLPYFYRNDVKTTGRFTRLPDLLPVSPANPNATGGYGGMWGDYNNDGFLDLYIGGQTPTYLFHNNGDGTFTDVTAAAGLTLPLPPSDYDWAHAGSWVDFDNDGDLDLHVSTYYGRPDLFYRNDGGVFTEIGADIGLRDNASSVEGSWGDFDGDGDLDFYAANWASGGPRLWRNEGGNSRNWLNVKLVGQISNHDGVGARVTIAKSQGTQMRELNSSGDLSENPLSLWFGLGTQTTVDTLTVRWPSGIVQTLHNVAVNQTTTVTETVPVGTFFFGKKRVGGDYDLGQAVPQPGSANPQPVMTMPGDQRMPAVSPDGRYILYDEGADYAPWNICVLDRITGETQCLLENVTVTDWHPTESRFLYYTGEFCSESIREAEISNGAIVSTRLIFDSNLPAGNAQYSPDGNQIAFNYAYGSCGYDNVEIVTAPLTGTVPLEESDLVRITTNNAHDYQPHWTPDGNEIVWLRANRQICRMNADGSGSEQCFSITAADANLFYLTTPPSGYRGPYLAAIYNHGDPKDIGLVKAEGNVNWLQIPDIERIDGLDWGISWPPALYIIALAFDQPFTATYTLAPLYADTLASLLQSSTGHPEKTIVVLADLPGDGDTHIRVIHNGTMTSINGLPNSAGTLDSALREYNMTNGETLGGFLKWARANYGAGARITFSYIGNGTAVAPDADLSGLTFNVQRGVLVLATIPMPIKIGGHSGWTDWTPHRAVISPRALKLALKTATDEGQNPIQVLDLVHCFAATLEEFDELAPYTEMLVGSPNYTYFDPAMAGAVVDALAPTQTPAQMATAIVETYNATLAAADDPATPYDDHPRILIAVDSHQVDGIVEAWEPVAHYVMEAFAQNYTDTHAKLLTAYLAAPKYDTCGTTWECAAPDALVDLHFAAALRDAFGALSPVGIWANTAHLRAEAAIVARAAADGTPWFAAPETPAWEFTGNLGIGLFAPFQAMILNGDLYLPWQAHWYNDNHFDFAAATLWDEVIGKFWENDAVQTYFCLPTMPVAPRMGELGVSRLIFPLTGTVSRHTPVQLAAAVTTTRIPNALVRFTVLQNNVAVFSDTVGTGYLPAGIHPIYAGRQWTPAATGEYTIIVEVNVDHRIIGDDPGDNARVFTDTVWAVATRPLIAATVNGGRQFVSTPQVALNITQVGGNAPVQYLAVQIYGYDPGEDPQTQTPDLLDMQFFPNVSLPLTSFIIDLSADLRIGPRELHIWGWSADGVSVAPAIVKFNYAPPATLAAGGEHDFLLDTAANDTWEFNLDVSAGDANLFVWDAYNVGFPTWQATHVGSDMLAFTAPFAGQYVLSVHGETQADYSLSAMRNGAAGLLRTGTGVNNPRAFVPTGRPTFNAPIPQLPEMPKTVKEFRLFLPLVQRMQP